MRRLGLYFLVLMVLALFGCSLEPPPPKFNPTSPEPYYLVTVRDVMLLTEPEGEWIRLINKGGLVTALGFHDGFWEVTCREGTGVVPEDGVYSVEAAREYFGDKWRKQMAEKEAQAREQREKEAAREAAVERAKQETKARNDLIGAKIEEIEAHEMWVSVFVANVREDPAVNSPKIDELQQGENVFIQETQNDWNRIFYGRRNLLPKYYSSVEDLVGSYKKGWIHKSLLSSTEVVYTGYEGRRRMQFVRTHPELNDTFKKAILDGRLMLGMTQEMALASWGEPIDRNRTVSVYGTSEQWVYHNIYVYFENGVLTSWQD